MRPKHAKPRSKKPLTRAAAALTLTCMISTAALPALAEGVQPEEAVQEQTTPIVEVTEETMPTVTVGGSASEQPEEAAPTETTEQPQETTPAEEAQTDAAALSQDAAVETEIALYDADDNTPSTQAATTSPVAAAKGEDITQEGNVTVNRENYAVRSNGGTITVNGDATGGVYTIMSYDGGTVTINGNVSCSSESAIYSDFNSTITVNGNVIKKDSDVIGNGAAVTNGGTLIVNGNVSMDKGYAGAYTQRLGGNITITGDLTAEAPATATICAIMGGGKIRIDGNVTGGARVGESADMILLSKSNNFVSIGKDVSTTSDSIIFNASGIVNGAIIFGDGNTSTGGGTGSETRLKNEIAIGGKVKNASDSVKDTVIRVHDNRDGSFDMPEFVVGEIEDFSKMKVTDGNGTELSDTVQQKVLDNIKYIVRYADKSEDGQAALTVTKSDGSAFAKDSSGTYEVARKGEEITVKVESIPGWVAKILPGKDNTVRENDDGSFTVTVVEGGGIDIRAVLEKIDKPTEPTNPDQPSKPDEDSDTDNSGLSAASAWLYVVGKDGSRVPYTQEQRGGVMVFTTAEETAALTGNLKALEELGVTAVQFVTPNKTSTFTVSTVCSAGGEDDVFVLAHDASGATLFAGNAVHSEYLS